MYCLEGRQPWSPVNLLKASYSFCDLAVGLRIQIPTDSLTSGNRANTVTYGYFWTIKQVKLNLMIVELKPNCR